MGHLEVSPVENTRLNGTSDKAAVQDVQSPKLYSRHLLAVGGNWTISQTIKLLNCICQVVTHPVNFDLLFPSHVV